MKTLWYNLSAESIDLDDMPDWFYKEEFYLAGKDISPTLVVYEWQQGWNPHTFTGPYIGTLSLSPTQLSSYKVAKHTYPESSYQEK